MNLPKDDGPALDAAKSRYLSGERKRVTPALLRRLDKLHAAWEAEVEKPGHYGTEAYHVYQEALVDAGLALIVAAKEAARA